MAERKTTKAEGETPPSTTNDDGGKTAKAESTVKETSKSAPQSAPLVPKAAKAETTPEPRFSTAPNAVAPQAPYDSNGTRLLTENGELCQADSCLDFPGNDDPRILVTVTQRIYREYRHRGSTTTFTKLLYPAGATITKAEAQRLKAEMETPEPEWAPGSEG